ncbi:MAG: hypothetical protein A2X28_02590 [Elusimicrobia bacterium GWA2_56_46]|nr:MAG: hypothetical protein A2X28_02590 [Elusimicrobia bacterium GWA2_56_46]OGR55351.1 MAG: hypothetical protein A2X39_00375 [Elusimicrobia bacterium GWC2_56_31]HBB67564.1 glycoside hydrolase [Elusimicrobiota bacterium]HBW23113.1 glycoside hydrolase [Elusimicrobiota bacterium]
MEMLTTILFLLLALADTVSAANKTPAAPPSSLVSTDTIRQKILSQKIVRGIHLTAWGAGSRKARRELIGRIDNSVINTVVIAIKEVDGKVYIPGVETAHRYGAYEPAISRPEEMLRDFKDAGLYTAARIVVFKDKIMPIQRGDMAVRTPDGGAWRANNGSTWLDPYNKEVWAYTLDIAERAAKLGFDEIQFDYLRYPTEGSTSLCRYARPHTSKTAVANLRDFLVYARGRLRPYKVKISADVFGLTTTAGDDMGIGQDLKTIAHNVDYIYPMMYPSHYYTGEYNLKNPNSQPYKVIDRGLKDALKRLGPDYVKLRPYLQDFSMGHHYGPHEVRAQIIAARRNMLESWVLWNAANRYNWAALTPQSFRAFVEPDYAGRQEVK